MTPIATRKKAPIRRVRQAIERGLASAFAYAVESGQQAMLKKDFISAKSMFQAGEIILPESAWASYLWPPHAHNWARKSWRSRS